MVAGSRRSAQHDKRLAQSHPLKPVAGLTSLENRAGPGLSKKKCRETKTISRILAQAPSPVGVAEGSHAIDGSSFIDPAYASGTFSSHCATFTFHPKLEEIARCSLEAASGSPCTKNVVCGRFLKVLSQSSNSVVSA